MTAAYIQVILSGILWGLTGIYVRYFTGLGMSSPGVVWLRVTLAGLVLILFLLLKDCRLLKVRLKDIWCFMGTGVLSLALFNFCYFTNITETSLSIACTMMYLSPIFVLLYSVMLFKERVTVQKVLACMLAIAGCSLVTGMFTDGSSITPRGILLGVLSGAGYGLYGVFSRLALNRGYKSLTITAYTFLFAMVGMAPFADFPVLGRSLDAMQWDGIFYLFLMLLTSVAPYILYTKGLERVSPSAAAIIVVIEPVCATLVGALLYGEPITWLSSLGMILVIGAIVLLNVHFTKGKGRKLS